MEFVYVVPRDQLFPACYPQGLVPFGDRTAVDGDGLDLDRFLDSVREHGFFVERDYAERTPSLKQVIPYSVTCCNENVLLLTRLRTGGDARLHDKLSIGVGGHINPEDLEATGSGANDATDPSAVRCPVRAGAEREIAEELVVKGETTLRPVGIINDDSNPVGAVHVGLVQVLTVAGHVEIREADVLRGQLVPPGELSSMLAAGANFETWSAMLIQRLEDFLPQPRPALI